MKRKNTYLRGHLKMLIVSGFMAIALCGCTMESRENATEETKQKLATDIDALNGNSVFETYTVARGDITLYIETQASADLDISSIVQPYEYGRVTYVKHLFEKGTYSSSYSSTTGKTTYNGYVKAGAPVALIRINVDPLDIEEARLELEKAELLYQSNLAKFEKDSPEYNKYVSEQEKSIAKLKEKYEFYLEGTRDVTLYAPCESTIHIYAFDEGDELAYNTSIGMVRNVEDFKLRANSSTVDLMSEYDFLNYGDKVTIKQALGMDREASELKGTVVSDSKVLYGDTSNNVTIVFDDLEYAKTIIKVDNYSYVFSVGADVTIAEDVLVIPPSAVEDIVFNTDEVGKFYPNIGTVTVYEDGKTYRKNITFAYIDSESVWVTGGLNEGDVVVLN